MSKAGPKRKVKFLRFGLSTLFLGTTLLCVWLGILVHSARQQQRIVSWVEEPGGRVYYDFELDEDGGPNHNPEPPGPVWLRNIVGIDFLADVEAVYFLRAKLDDTEPLYGLTDLQWLEFDDTYLSEGELERLRRELPNCTVYYSTTPPEFR